MTQQIIIHPGDPRSPEATALLEASHALMQSLFPDDSCHYLSIDGLCAPNITFFVADIDGVALGCGALAKYDGYGELKSMFVSPEARGKGIAEQLLLALIDLAKTNNQPLLRLETGDTLTAAHKLYVKHGFTFRGPFGDYPDHPQSLFMEKLL